MHTDPEADALISSLRAELAGVRAELVEEKRLFDVLAESAAAVDSKLRIRSTELEQKIERARGANTALAKAIERLTAALQRLIFKPPEKSKSDDGLETELRAALAQAGEACRLAIRETE